MKNKEVFPATPPSAQTSVCPEGGGSTKKAVTPASGTVPGKDNDCESGTAQTTQPNNITNSRSQHGFLSAVSPVSIPQPATDFDATTEARIFLHQTFKADDIICIATEARTENQADGTLFYRPGSAVNLINAEDLDTLLASGNPIETLIDTYDRRHGVCIGIVPVNASGAPTYKQILVTCNAMDPDLAYAQLLASGLPITSIIADGTAVHALIKAPTGIRSKQDYAQQANKLHNALKGLGMTGISSSPNFSYMVPFAGFARGLITPYLLPVPTCPATRTLSEWYATLPLIAKNAAIDRRYGRPSALTSMEKPRAEEHDWIIEQILRAGQLLEIVGKSKAGKSLLTLQAALSICSGADFLGHKCAGGKRVLYVNLEISSEDFISREIDELIELSKTHRDIPGLETWNLRGADLQIDSFIEALIVKVKLYHYDVVIIDPIYILFKDVDENDNSGATSRFAKLQSLMQETGCACIIVHHESDKQNSSLPSGASAYMRIYDTLMSVDRVKLPDGFPEGHKRGDNSYRISLSYRNNAEEEPIGAWRQNLIFTPDVTGVLAYCDSDSAIGSLDRAMRKKKIEEALERLNAS